ncbi:MAG TPA: putative molybdenum carrier protein [bacterium]|nr:putative molybdenum carrier protein [bacterium]
MKTGDCGPGARARRGLKIVTGGQTGADRGALDAARALGLDWGGAIPAGRRTEVGPLPEEYDLMTELSSSSYRERTLANVRDADAVLVFTSGKPRGGTALTLRAAGETGKPRLLVDLRKLDPEAAAGTVRAWLRRTGPRVLNVAGPRESKAPGIAGEVLNVLLLALRP